MVPWFPCLILRVLICPFSGIPANNIDSQYPDAAPQDLASLSDDDICAICLKVSTLASLKAVVACTANCLSLYLNVVFVIDVVVSLL